MKPPHCQGPRSLAGTALRGLGLLAVLGRALLLASAGWTPGTNGKVEGDVVLLTARTKEDLAKYKGKLKNAIVLRSPPSEVRPITDMTDTLWGGPGGRGRQGERGRPPEK